MSLGNRIVLTPDRGVDVEGYLASGETLYPGMCVQIDATQALQGNRLAWKIYDRDADGDHPVGPYIIVKEDILQGKSVSDAYATAAGTQLFGFIPWAGCELNLLLKDISGTGDDHPAGEILMVDDGTGKFIVTTGSPESEPALLLETVTDPVADTLAHCIWTDH